MVNKELIEAIRQGDLATVERLLAIKSIKENVHANDNEALQDAAGKGHLAVVERLLAIQAVKENAHVFDNWALRLAAMGGHLAVVRQLLAIETVKKNAHARDNYALQWAAMGGHLAVVGQLLAIETVKKNAYRALQGAAQEGHLAIVERLLTIQTVKENAHACDNAALRSATRNGQLTVVFFLAKTYLLLNRQLPMNITIQDRALVDFVKDYQEKLENVADELVRIFPKTLVKIIDDYAEMALGVIINKPTQQNQAFDPGIVSSDLSFAPALTFSMQTAAMFSDISTSSTSSHRTFIRGKSKKEKIIK